MKNKLCWLRGDETAKLVPATHDGIALPGFAIDGDGGWWFWDETGSEACGPYGTYDDARKGVIEYARNL